MKTLSLAVALALLLGACQSTTESPSMSEPPIAEKRSSERSYHGKTLHDDYLWLKDESYPEVDDEDILDYLVQENHWYEQQMAPRQALVDTLFEEMKGRVEDDLTAVPWRTGDYLYRWRFAPGSEYRLWERRPISGGEFVTILDEAVEAEGLEFFSRGTFSVSPDGRMLAWSADVNGSERYRLVFDDLQTGERFDDGISNAASSKFAWAADSKTVYYGEMEQEGWYSQRVKSHIVGTPASQDREIFFNPDRSYFLGLSESQSREYVLIELNNRVTSEVFYFPSAQADAKPELFSPRRDGHDYSVDHGNGQFYILTNDQHINFRLAVTSEAATQESHWQTLLPPADDVYYKDFAILADFVAVQEMSEGLNRIRVKTRSGEEHHIAFPEPVYTANLQNNPDIHSDTLRIGYESMMNPYSIYDYDPGEKALDLRRQQKIPSGFDGAQYVTTRVWAPARDGVRVPVSLVHRKDVKIDGTAPLLLTGYGSYGHGSEPYFSSARLSLLDRGVIYAIAHTRGGDEMGRQWYLDGKLEKRRNTFNDFVDSTRYLAEQGYGREGNIAIVGGSAGGELVGAALIQAPELYGAAVLQVPFVDVLNTMLDATLPLTPPEWMEWGNPIESAEAFDLIQGYSPYDNIEARDYPPMMVTGGLNDPRVTYWEPAKWTAKMRALKTDDNELIMKINMGAGHQGKSGRYASLYEAAEYYAFVLAHLGVEQN